MKLGIIGAGRQAQALIEDLLRDPDIYIMVADIDRDQLKRTNLKYLNTDRIRTVSLSANGSWSIRQMMLNLDACISAVPYQHNLNLTECAISAGCNFCDLGGNNDITNQQFALNQQAIDNKVTIIPDCGLAPGLVSILTAHAYNYFDELESVKIRVGGLPQERDGYLNYSLTFNIDGLINEYIEDALILEDWEVKRVPSLENVEHLRFPGGYDHLEAFTTSGGISSLPYTYTGKIKNLDYKTVRYQGHRDFFYIAKHLELLSERPMSPVTPGITARRFFSHIVKESLNTQVPDLVFLRLTATGKKDGKMLRRTYEHTELSDDRLSAMMKMTAFPAAIILKMLGQKEHFAPGVLRQEEHVGPEFFLAELAKRGIDIKISEIGLAPGGQCPADQIQAIDAIF